MYEGGTTEDRWSRYRSWNAALASVICGPEFSGLPVFLDLEEDVLEKVAIAAGYDSHDPRSGLISAVRPTLNPPSHRAGMFGSHKAQLLRWHIESGDPPPTLALLAVLSLAAEDMHGGDGFATHDYYNRLMALLNVTDEHDKELIIKAYRRCSADLWDSLNNWLTFHEGELGSLPHSLWGSLMLAYPFHKQSCAQLTARSCANSSRTSASPSAPTSPRGIWDCC
ncbi:MAG: hypothetical protein M1305_03050 [Candidatus Marsarchaeota archaeon]|nr:hypothetical protein [Candidatus Marsarchaeota archaeon]